jgi:hypothetical protein
MVPNLRSYKVNKIISLSWVFVVIALSSWWLGYGVPQWQIILLTLMTFGYTHFIIGFIYQCKSFLRKPNPKQHFITLAFLCIVTLVFAEALFALAGYAFALFVGFAYFLLHGLFNEQTLIRREAGIHVPLIYIVSLAIFIMSLLTFTVPDPTFLFDRSLTFFPVDSFLMTVTFAGMGIKLSVFPYIFWGGMVVSFLVLFLAWRQSKNHQLTLFLGGSYLLIILATAFWGALPYIYMYFLVVGYHFMTWFLFYVREMRGRAGTALRDLLMWHGIILIPFLVGAWLFFTPNTPGWVYQIFDYKYFVVATYVHISTSFMNDGWFQHLQAKVFSHFG